MAVRPLSPATDRRLGGPLPHQLSNRTRIHLYAINLWYRSHAKPIRYAVLAAVSSCYPPHTGRLFTRYSPVRHWSISPEGNATVRLECVMHAASVYPEPGSNSRMLVFQKPQKRLFKSISELWFSSLYFFWVNSFDYSFLRNCRDSKGCLHPLSFRTICCCSIFKDHVIMHSIMYCLRQRLTALRSSPPLLSTAYLLYHSFLRLSSVFSNFFKLFSIVWSFFERKVSFWRFWQPLNCWLYYYTTFFLFCQYFFQILFSKHANFNICIFCCFYIPVNHTPLLYRSL